jgi:hypothetical protein
MVPLARFNGNSDAASSRYLATKIEDILETIFKRIDDNLLTILKKIKMLNMNNFYQLFVYFLLMEQ